MGRNCHQNRQSHRCIQPTGWTGPRRRRRTAGLDALLLTPGAGPALPHRLRGAPAGAADLPGAARPPATPFLVVPSWSSPPRWRPRPGGLGLEIVGWEETDDPYALVAAQAAGGRPGSACRRPHVGRDGAGGCGPRCPAPSRRWPARCCAALRIRKSAAEVAALRDAGAAIDRVHARVGELAASPAGPSVRSAARHRRRDRRRGPRQGGLRHRRLGAERRQPAPRRCPTG